LHLGQDRTDTLILHAANNPRGKIQNRVNAVGKVFKILAHSIHLLCRIEQQGLQLLHGFLNRARYIRPAGDTHPHCPFEFDFAQTWLRKSAAAATTARAM
jgi:hypothetical protein